MGFSNQLRRVRHKLFLPLRMLQNSHLSTSQYGEDILFNCLLKPGKNGIYIDVGAHHPFVGSNTYRLYSQGWRGLTIDPNPIFESVYTRYRPDENHLVEGVSKIQGELTYFEFDHDVFNTFSVERATELENQGQEIRKTSSIRCRPLFDIVNEYLQDKQIDLLNVDCEGLDKEVIESIDLKSNRPTVIIVEDYITFKSFQQNQPISELRSFLQDNNYSPIAQSAWSSIFVANDWRVLFEKSTAYLADRVQNGYLPNSAADGA